MKYFPIFFLSILVSSCSLKKGDKMLTEKGKVVAKQFAPDTRQMVTGYGFSTNGDFVITFHNIGEDQKFNVVFQCEHGVLFTINKPEIYTKLNENDSVNIDYWELKNRKGVVKDYDFVDANKIVW